jgi:hypothetical protein
MEREMRSQLAFDQHLYTQIGLDSGALTQLGAVVHSFGEAGEYRGTARRGDLPEATFQVSVDPTCAIAQVDIDLAALVDENDPCGDDGRHFTVHPKGFAVFRVSKGSGGYWVNVRRADEDRAVKAYDSRRLEQGDIFAALLLRPGRYSIANELSKARGELTVAYPTVGKTAYRPPAALNAECGDTIKPSAIRLKPVQGLNIHATGPARINIKLVEPDDGPKSRRRPASRTSKAPPRKK